MKKLFFFLLLIFSFHQQIAGQVFDVEKLLDNGSSDKRINFVYLGDGYIGFEQNDFITDTQNVVNAQFSITPYKEYKNFFNAYAIKVISLESGVDHPTISGNTNCNPVPQMEKNTFFDSTFDYAGIHRLLLPTAYGKIASVLADNTPFYDQANILVNTPYYGGSGGTYATSSTHTDASLIMIHEIGHSFVDLADEYWAGIGYAEELANMTQESNTAQVKWKNWINNEGIGVYPYGTSSPESDWFRPHQSCMMRFLSSPFCSVCQEATIDRIYTLLSPIESFLPTTSTVVFDNADLDFSIDLILPDPNTLEVEWLLDNIVIASATNNITLTSTELTEPSHELVVNVEDTTSLSRTYTFANGYLFSLTWNITNESAGVSDNQVKKFIYKVYPNPAQDILYFNYTAQNIQEHFDITITNLQGKRITSTTFIPEEGEHQFPFVIDTLASGVYILTVRTPSYQRSFKFLKE